MKILIEAQSLLRERTGVGQYTFNLIDHLIPKLKEKNHELTLFYFNFLKRNREIPSWNGSVTSREESLIPGRCFYYLWKKTTFPPIDWLTGKVDLLHFPNFIVRPFRKGKAVVTIHDLSFVRYPEFAEKKNLAYLSRWIPRTLKQASKILVVSHFTKKELQELYDVPENKIVVAPNGVGREFQPVTDQENLNAVRQIYQLPQEYLLAVGTLEPRKNLSLTIRALSHLKQQKKEVPPLVLVGPPGWNDEYRRLKEMVASAGLEEKVRFLFYVDRKDMPALYSAAKILLFPSLYEGFGLPVLEAMACATPVLSSNAASLPEVGGEGAWSLSPHEPQEWSQAILNLWEDATKQQQMAEKGLQQAQKFTWSRTAEKTIEAYEQANRD